MTIPVLLFVYNRVDTTRKVLESIQCNKIDKLIIFQDGPEKDNDFDWMAVNELINKIDWCDTELYVSKHNKGLDASILQGINYCFQKYDSVIVIEDDCYLHKDFYRFIKSCLEKYTDDKSIYTVTGYAWPIRIPDKYNKSVYTSYRISSWGWGTWKDRWKNFSIDYRALNRIKSSPLKKHYLKCYGRDLEDMLTRILKSSNEPWDAFWALNTIENEGKTISPVKNLVSNIGYGKNGGTHNSMRTVFNMDLYEGDFKFELPDELTSEYELEAAFNDMVKKYFSLANEQSQYYRDALNRWIQLKNKHISLEDILIKRGINNCVIFGTTAETSLLINDLGKNVSVKYILTSKGTENPVNGINVSNTISCVGKDTALIVIPGFIIEDIKINWDLSGFGIIIGLKELLELG